jgi:hypothetical protein
LSKKVSKMNLIILLNRPNRIGMCSKKYKKGT